LIAIDFLVEIGWIGAVTAAVVSPPRLGIPWTIAGISLFFAAAIGGRQVLDRRQHIVRAMGSEMSLDARLASIRTEVETIRVSLQPMLSTYQYGITPDGISPSAADGHLAEVIAAISAAAAHEPG
jgi:hypothetical protein